MAQPKANASRKVSAQGKAAAIGALGTEQVEFDRIKSEEDDAKGVADFIRFSLVSVEQT